MIALKILDMLLRLYMLIVLAVVIIRVLQVTPNKWTNLLDRMTEPLLSPIRAQLNKHLPESWNADWRRGSCRNITPPSLQIFRLRIAWKPMLIC